MNTNQEEAFDRTQEDDHDLLTFGEAGIRLREAIDELRARIAATDDNVEATALRRRLDLLTSAAERNRRQPITDETFERFFGYPGSARRNTDWR